MAVKAITQAFPRFLLLAVKDVSWLENSPQLTVAP
jgi:hypothetical protein